MSPAGVRPGVCSFELRGARGRLSGIGCLLLLLSASLLNGCGGHASASAGAEDAVAVNGRVVGGDQPVSGADLTLYQAGVGTLKAGAINLMKTGVKTDANGEFVLTGTYTPCTAGSYVYLVARGGNPGLAAGTNNAAIVLISPLGACGSLLPTTYIDITEATTAATAWSLAQFFGAGAIAGTSATNTVGLGNAFAVSNELINTATGSAPGTLAAGAVTESAKLNTLADALSGCVNSDGTAACNRLFSAATVSGVAPANVFDAALNIVRNPGANVAAVFQAVPSNGAFQPTLAQAPNDWTMSIGHRGFGVYEPASVALDSQGNVWVADYAGGGTTRFAPGGAGLFVPNAGLYENYGIAVDGNDHIWITNEEGNSSNRNYNGSVTVLDTSGNQTGGSPYTQGNVYYPYNLAIDTDNTVWIADNGRSGATLLANNGVTLSGSGGYSPPGMYFPVAVALDGAHNAWFAAEQSAVKVTASGASTAYLCCNAPTGIALDSAGDVWISDYTGNAVTELNGAGTTLQTVTSQGGLNRPHSVAVDGGNNIWVTNYQGQSVSEFSPGTAGAVSQPLSPASGLGLDAGLNQPFRIAVDSSGNLWVPSFQTSSVVEFVGLAVPLRTPLRGLPAAP